MKEMVCIVCPNGCLLHIDTDGNDLKISGQKCKKGLAFAKTEITAPMRTVCSTVKTAFKDVPVLPVRTDREIPKEKIFSVMAALNSFVLQERCGIGEVLIEKICGTDADIIATSNILKE